MLASLWHPTEFAALVQWKLTKVGDVLSLAPLLQRLTASQDPDAIPVEGECIARPHRAM
jgi:hypothetical protein